MRSRGLRCLPGISADIHEQGENSARAGDVFSQVLASSSQNLLADDSERLADALVAGREKGEERIDIVVDNAGGRTESMSRISQERGGRSRGRGLQGYRGTGVRGYRGWNCPKKRKMSRFGRLRIKSR